MYTGRNGVAVRAFLHDHPAHQRGDGWFLTKGMAAATGGQAWRYAQGTNRWPSTVDACLYDPVAGDWIPLPRGATVERTGILSSDPAKHGYAVTPA